MRELTLSEIERVQAAEAEGTVPFAIDEDAFRVFYDRTARPLWAYLSRLTGDGVLADDLLQETYYRLLRSNVRLESEAHGRNYLFRIATNLARDMHRRRAARPEQQLGDSLGSTDFRLKAEATSYLAEATSYLAEATSSLPSSEQRADLRRAWMKMKPRERAILWLAYAQGSSHRDIGDALGVKTGSIKVLLFRARRKLASLLRGQMEGARREQA